jgi:tRNA C32,U32 (ribose-2'-O)-methylase TrmJ
MLERIDFFKTRQPEFVMRSLRETFFRADLDGREATPAAGDCPRGREVHREGR